MQPECAPTILVTLANAIDLELLAREWRELEACAAPSFFTSWTWIGSWIGSLPADLRPRLLRASAGSRVVGLALLGAQESRRHGVMPVCSYFLHATGDADCDRIMVEYNGMLVDQAIGELVEQTMLDHLINAVPEWEELHLDGVVQVPPSIATRDGVRLQIERRPAYSVDLAQVRATSGGYLALLAHKPRYQIRRSLRAYEALGPVMVSAAKTIEHARDYMTQMKALHQAHWASLGGPGAFAKPFANRFHDQLLEAGFPRGEIQLLRVAVGPRPIGYLYNFVLSGRVYNYQTGIDYSLFEGSGSPGLVMHAFAVDLNCEMGHSVYDFMAGDHRYKRSMCTHTDHLNWLIVRRDLFKFRIEDALRRFKRRMQSLTTTGGERSLPKVPS